MTDEIREIIEHQVAEGIRIAVPQIRQEMANQQTQAQVLQPAPRPVEIKIGHPTTFNGDLTIAQQWVNQVLTYLTLNEAIYNTDEKKIIFAISFMSEGTAAAWASARNAKALKTDDSGVRKGWGTWLEFGTDFAKAFNYGDHELRARGKLQSMKQTGTVDDYISEFRTQAGISNITDDRALIGYFQMGIKPYLMNRIYAMETVPTTIEVWMEKAALFDDNFRTAQNVSQNNPHHGAFQRPQFKPKFHQTARPRDPNAMDVDRITLSPEEKDRYFKEALCFECGQRGHRAAVCRNCQGPSRPRFNPSRTNIRATDTQRDPKGTAISIKALLEGMTEEEKATTFKTLGEDVDF